MSKKKFLTAQRMAVIAIFSALMCVCSWIVVPSPFNPAVPFTLQTLAIILTGLILSPAEAVFSSLVYLMLGVVGLPVFSGFGTLYSRMFTATGGYIIGLILAPLLIALARSGIFKLTDRINAGKAKKRAIHFAVYVILAIVLGIVIIDAPGVVVGKLITNADWATAVFGFALSFMPTDILKCVAAAILALALENPLSRLNRI